MSDFTDLAQHRFRFLVEKHGYACHVVSQRMVSYTTLKVVICIGFGERGGISLTFDQMPPTFDYPFELYLKEFFPDEEAKLGELQAYSKFEIDLALTRLANLLNDFGKAIIYGDHAMF